MPPSGSFRFTHGAFSVQFTVTGDHDDYGVAPRLPQTRPARAMPARSLGAAPSETDYGSLGTPSREPSRKKTRRGKRGGKKSSAPSGAAGPSTTEYLSDETVDDFVDDAPVQGFALQARTLVQTWIYRDAALHNRVRDNVLRAAPATSRALLMDDLDEAVYDVIKYAVRRVMEETGSNDLVEVATSAFHKIASSARA